MIAFLSFLGSPIGRIVALATAVAIALGAWTLHERSVGATKLTTKIEKQNRKSAHVADAIRKGVKARCSVTPAPADCLRDGWTRDN